MHDIKYIIDIKILIYNNYSKTYIRLLRSLSLHHSKHRTQTIGGSLEVTVVLEHLRSTVDVVLLHVVHLVDVLLHTSEHEFKLALDLLGHHLRGVRGVGGQLLLVLSELELHVMHHDQSPTMIISMLSEISEKILIISFLGTAIGSYPSH